MRKVLFLIMLAMLFSTAWAQHPNIVLHGHTDNATGKIITLSNYSDPLSMREMQIDEAVIDEEGDFTLRAYANYPMLIVLQIENYSQSFYVEPGRTYEMYLPEFDWDINERINVNLAPVALPFQFLNLPANEMNLSIARFNAVVDSFVYENRIHFDFKLRPNKAYFDTLMQVVERLCPDTDNDYFNRYKLYHLAQLKYEMRFATRRKMYDTLLRNQPIRYYDDNYMHFVLSFFENSVSKGNRYLNIRDVSVMVARLYL